MKNKNSITKSLIISLFIHFLAVALFLNNSSSLNNENQSIDIDLLSSPSAAENDQNNSQLDKNGQEDKTNSYGVEDRQIIDKDEFSSINDSSTESFIGLGIQLSLEQTFVTVENNRFRGVKIDKVFKGYSAEKAGILEGDILLKVDGIKITENNSSSLLVFHKPKKVFVELFRNDKVLKYNISIDKVLVANVKNK